MRPISVQIIPSLSLQRLRLTELVGRTATIIEPIDSTEGCWVRLNGTPYQEWSDWYIPYESLMFKDGDRYTTSLNIIPKKK